jgi:hypothetical protein
LNFLRVFERNTIRKIYGPIKEEGSWRIRTNKEKNDTLRRPRTLKLIRWTGHTEGMNYKKMPKTVTVKMKEIRKRPQKRNTDDIEEALKINGTRNWQAMARDRRELRWNVLEVKVHRNCRVQRGGKKE